MTTGVSEWERWLREWNGQLLADLDPEEGKAFIDPAITPAVIASGWLGSPGAGEEEVAALERRLGVRLPPSYRSFLLASNGFLQPGLIVSRLLAAREVEWYRVAHQDTIDTWCRGLAAGAAPAGPDAFEHHLPHALQVSAVERVGTAVYLLDPDEVGPDGEWQAFYFAHWIPGVHRYPSFRALMLAEQESWLAPPPPPPPSRWSTFRDALRWIFRPS
jgi:hypothetical protein